MRRGVDTATRPRKVACYASRPPSRLSLPERRPRRRSRSGPLGDGGMLSSPQPSRRRLRPGSRSLKQEYEEFLLQRIEEFKDQLSRDQLLAIADEAVRELEMGSEDQLVLTEVLVLEHVDRLIMRRLHLPSYRRWRQRHLRLRRAQQEPTHWGLEAGTPLEDLAARLEDGEVALVVGAGALPAGFYLAAHDAAVMFIDPALSTVEAAEQRAAAEALGNRFQALVVSFETWFPEVEPEVAVLDPLVLGGLEPTRRQEVVETVKARTRPGGAHLVLPADPPAGVTPLAPEALQIYYGGWVVERGRRNARSRWFLAYKP